MAERITIVTSHGMDGACSAAMILLKYPKAFVRITSAQRVGLTLEEIADSDDQPTELHICGLGFPDDVQHLSDVLRRLKGRGIPIYWYCGRGYLNEYKTFLRPFCTTVFESTKSNTQVVYRRLRPLSGDRVELLLTLAGQFVRGQTQAGGPYEFWHDFVNGSVARYFKYGDRSSYVHAIQKLAGILPCTDADRSVAQTYSRNRRLVPIGESAAMRALREQIARLGPIDEPVLILGPTGSGKEIAAWGLHEISSRRNGQFVPVNCALLSVNVDLAHDRLFGHVAGAYTGARTHAPGAFEEADKGTLFFDEVAELPLPIQAQLLRVLEDSTITPLGTVRPRRVDVRIVAATHQDLRRKVREGKFRDDLFYRLNVLRLRVPSLKERLEDLKSISRAVNFELKRQGYSLRLTQEDWKAAYEYDWPGNVRQFINLLKRSAYCGRRVRDLIEEEKREFFSGENSTDTRTLEDLWIFRPRHESEVLPELEVRRSYMRHVLSLYGGNWTKAARALGVSVNTLRSRLSSR